MTPIMAQDSHCFKRIPPTHTHTRTLDAVLIERQALLYKFFAAALLAAVVFVWTAAFMSNTLFCLFLILF